MNFKNRDIISIRDFEKSEILHVLKTAKRMETKPNHSLMRGEVMASLFFEPSTRTRLSFESAMRKIGGEVIGFSDPSATSLKKGETLWDTIKMAERYADVIVMRHPVEGAARLAAEAASVPIINGGDGANQHPTQTMLDLYTIQKAKGKLEGLNIGFLGDLKYGRTVHSLAYALSLYKTPLSFISPDLLRMPDYLVDEIRANGSTIYECNDLDELTEPLDILYATRIQKERFGDMQEYERVAGTYRVTPETVQAMGGSIKIMHPLPRVYEIAPEVDSLENAIYFKQAHNGIPVRQAILGLVTGAIS